MYPTAEQDLCQRNTEWTTSMVRVEREGPAELSAVSTSLGVSRKRQWKAFGCWRKEEAGQPSATAGVW